MEREDLAMNIVRMAERLSMKARREGLVALEDDIRDLDGKSREVFKLGLQLAVDGEDREYIRRVLSNIIDREKDGEARRHKVMEKEAVLSIQARENLRIAVYKLLYHLREDELKGLSEEYDEDCFDYRSLDTIARAMYEKPNMRNGFAQEAARAIRTLTSFSETARREGLLSLEESLDDLDDMFMKDGLRHMVDGTDGDIIDDILSTIIDNEPDEDARRLKLIKKEAILDIQRGTNHRLIALNATAFLRNHELKAVESLFSTEDFSVGEKFPDDIVGFWGDDRPWEIELEDEGEKPPFTHRVADLLFKTYRFCEIRQDYGRWNLKGDIDREKAARRDFFEYGMALMMEMLDPEQIHRILSNMLTTERDAEELRLKKIQMKALTGIYRAEDPATFLHELASHMDDDEIEQALGFLLVTHGEAARSIAPALRRLPDKRPDEKPALNPPDKRPAKSPAARALTPASPETPAGENPTDAWDAIDLTNDASRPIDFIRRHDPEAFAALVREEHPCDAAFVLANLLAHYDSARGAKRVAEMLMSGDLTTETRILAALSRKHRKLCTEIRQHIGIGILEDIVLLSNPDVQRVLCRVDSQILTKALKDVDIGIREKIFRNMRDDAAAMLIVEKRRTWNTWGRYG